MERELRIAGLENALHIKKDNGTEVWYHMAEEYEIHLNRIAPHSEQERDI